MLNRWSGVQMLFITDLQKQVADLIIAFYKSRNGTQYNGEAALAEIDQNKIPLANSRLALNMLLYNRLLAPAIDGPPYLILTAKGWEYEKYDTFQAKQKRDEALESDEKESVITTNKISRLNVYATIIFGLVVTSVTIIICKREADRERRELN